MVKIVAPELMPVQGVIDAVGLAGVLLFFLSPTLLLIFIIYSIRRFIRKRKHKSKKIKDIDIKTIPEKPKDIEKFRSLELTFDETGHVKK